MTTAESGSWCSQIAMWRTAFASPKFQHRNGFCFGSSPIKANSPLMDLCSITYLGRFTVDSYLMECYWTDVCPPFLCNGSCSSEKKTNCIEFLSISSNPTETVHMAMLVGIFSNPLSALEKFEKDSSWKWLMSLRLPPSILTIHRFHKQPCQPLPTCLLT